MAENGVPGFSVAFGREGQIAFEAGYGFADVEKKESVTPQHRFRIASISKPITATAVMMAAEKGLLKLDSKVFGPQGILGETYGAGLPEKITSITVDHLLMHTSGGWGNDRNDPMFADKAMTHDELIPWALKNGVQPNEPGKAYAYSNFGYCVLGRVLEKVTKMPYETLLKEHVLTKCGVTSMQLGGNTLAERKPKEVVYHMPDAEAPYRMNVTRMDAHGGWISTAGDLVRFAGGLEKLINADSMRTMTTAGVSASYARGWNVNKVPNWWHTGSLPGTATIMVRTAKGICWAGLMNTRSEGLGGRLDELMWKLARAVRGWL
jgi:CubicO group peptidase (beta-lactamase class C family)